MLSFMIVFYNNSSTPSFESNYRNDHTDYPISLFYDIPVIIYNNDK